MWSDALWNHPLVPLQWGVVLATGLVAAFTDLRTGKISNKLVLPVFLAGVVVGTVARGWGGLGDALLGSFIMFMPYFVLFALAGGGAGDAKLMAALGVWLGSINALICLACIAGCGVLFAMGHALMQSRFKEVLCNVGSTLRHFFEDVFLLRTWRDMSLVPESQETKTMPYAVATFFGLCLAAGGIMLWTS